MRQTKSAFTFCAVFRRHAYNLFEPHCVQSALDPPRKPDKQGVEPK